MTEFTLTYAREQDGKHIFLCNQRWTAFSDWNRDVGVLPFEEYLEDTDTLWYWGGNRYMKSHELDYGLIVFDQTAAVGLVLAGLAKA